MLDLRLAIEDNPPPGGVPLKTRCLNPEHHDKTASMAVYNDHLHCFGCGWDVQGVRGLAALLKTDEFAAAKTLNKYTVEQIDGYRERAAMDARRDPLPLAHAVMFNTFLRESRRDRLDWLYARGLTDYTIEQFLLGHDGERFVIPVLDEQGRLISLRYRMDPAFASEDDLRKHKYMGLKGRNGRYLFPEYELGRDGRDWVVLCEGEFDAMMLWQDDTPAVTITNGAGQCHKIPALLPERIKHVYIATDMDEAGEAARVEVANACKERGLDYTQVVLPEGVKDITEAYLRGWRFKYS